MNPELKTTLFNKKRWQFAHMRIDQQGHATLREGAYFSQGQSQIIRGHCNRFGMEVPTRDNVTLSGEYQRVIRDAVCLNQQGLGAIAYLIETGSHYLGLASQRVRVLDSFTILVKLFDLTVPKQETIACCNIDLALVPPDLMDQMLNGRRLPSAASTLKEPGQYLRREDPQR